MGILPLLKLVQPYRRSFVLALVALAAGSGINLLFPEVIRQLLNTDYKHLLSEHPLMTAVGLIILFAAQGIFFYARSYIFAAIGHQVVAKLRRDLYRVLINNSIEFFDNNKTGDLVSRINSDTQLVQDAVSLRLSVLIRYSFQVFAGIALMIMISPLLTGTIVLALPILVGVSIFLARKLKRCSKEMQTELGVATSIAEETFSSVRIVKAFGKEGFEEKRFNSSIDDVLALGLTRTSISAFFSSFVSFLMNACIVLILVYGAWLVSSASLSFGDLTAFVLYGVIVAVSFSFLASGYTEVVQAAGAVERVLDLIDESSPLESTEETELKAKSSYTGRIEFKGVGFAYPTRPDIDVLSDVSCTLLPKTCTALVGPSGAGKSTIVNLLLKFYAPTSGTITLDGTDLGDIPGSHLRSLIGIVPQEPELFGLSIRENLRYGREDATDDELVEVCQKANILDFIQSLPKGFETVCGQRGTQLSGGQKQRVAIARAMLRDPILLILDEATSALDSENEGLIQEAFHNLIADRTTIVIAHRLSTIKNADQVLVIEGGSIVQSGTHDSLAAQPGLYQRLVKQQDLLFEANVA